MRAATLLALALLWALPAAAQTVTVTPSVGQVRGTATNDNAAAGNVGEIIESTVLIGSAVGLTNNTPISVTSISLTAGDWDVWGNIALNPNAATTTTFMHAAINTVDATLPTLPGAGAYQQSATALGAGVGETIPTGMRRLSLSATTTVYLVTNVAFAINTNSAYGYLGARRVR